MTKSFIQLFLSRLEHEGAQYAVLRGWEDLPEKMNGDMDIWIAPEDYEQMKRIVHDVLVQTNGYLVSYLNNMMTPRYCFLAPNWGLQLDVCPMAMQHKCANYMPEDFASRNTIIHNGIKVLSPQADVYLAFLKEILNNGYSQKNKYVINLREYLKCTSQEEVKKNLKVYSDSTIKLLFEQVMDENRQRYPELAKAMRKDILPVINIRHILNQMLKCRRLFVHPGYTIVVLGTDGSGKSAIIDAITPWLDEAFHDGVTYKHFRPGLLPDLGVIFGKRSAGAPEPKVVSNPHSGKPSGFFGSMLRLLYYMLDYSFGYLKLIWPQVAMHTKVYIFDRYYYDYYIDPLRSLISLPYWILRMGEVLVPKPDIILCLGGDPEKIYARKPETSLVEVKRQTEELRHFAQKRENAVWIDTTKPIDESIADAKSAILAMMSKRFKDVL